MKDFHQEPYQSHNSKKRLLGMSILLLILIGVFVYMLLDSRSTPNKFAHNPSPWLDPGGESKASNVTPRCFSLWELYSDDTVRFIETFYDQDASGSYRYVDTPPLLPGEDPQYVKIIEGELINESIHQYEYKGNFYEWTWYTIMPTQNHYGCEALLDAPPHLHTDRPDRLISIGYDPQPYSYYAQDITAIAIPISANVTSIYDYQPYRHIEIDEWDVFYYDTTDIAGHVSIHITYEPGNESSPLDCTEVEASR